MNDKSRIDGTGLDALEQALERYGSDRTRWPAPVRRDFAGLLARDTAAKARLREAEALDRLLDLAPQPEADTKALADRILAAAASERPVFTQPVYTQPTARVAWASGTRRRDDTPWAAGALLAASLVLGAFFGLNGTFDAALSPMVAAASSEADIDSSQIAFDSDSIGMFEEDLL